MNTAEPLTPSGREERLDLDALEKIALAATTAGQPEGWQVDKFGNDSFPWGVCRDADYGDCLAITPRFEDAAYVATFDPPTVLRLIAAARHPISSEDDNAGGADTARAGELSREEIAKYLVRLEMALRRDDLDMQLDFDEPGPCEMAERIFPGFDAMDYELSAAPIPTQEGADDNAGAGETGGRG